MRKIVGDNNDKKKKGILKSISFRSLFWFDLVTLTCHENSNHGRENYWKSGVWIPAPEGQNFFVLFLFIFKFSIKICISLCLTILNQISIKETFSTCFIGFLNNRTRYQKMAEINDTQFCVKNLKMKRNKG